MPVSLGPLTLSVSVRSQMKWTTTVTFLTVFKYSVSYEKCPLLSFCPGSLYRWHAQCRAIAFQPSETSCHRAVKEKRICSPATGCKRHVWWQWGCFKKGVASLYIAHVQAHASFLFMLFQISVAFICSLHVVMSLVFFILIHHSTNHFSASWH